jgi:cell division protein CrgA
VSKPAARKPTLTVSGYETSLVRCAIALLLVLAGIVWITVYTQFAMDAANYVKLPGVKKPDTPFPWMSDLKRWNYVIGFGLILVWIVTYYFVGQDSSVHIPVMDQLNQSNLLVGVGFMAVGFTFATKWE